jgi:hypothetical protein
MYIEISMLMGQVYVDDPHPLALPNPPQPSAFHGPKKFQARAVARDAG